MILRWINQKNNIVDGKMIDTSINTNDIIENQNVDDCILHQIEQILTGLIKRKHFCLLINDINDNKTHKIIGFKSLNDDKIRYLQYPKNMNKLIFKDLDKLKDIINVIIKEMNNIVYREPYDLLLGRIKHAKTIDTQDPKNEINENFYEGLSLD